MVNHHPSIEDVSADE